MTIAEALYYLEMISFSERDDDEELIFVRRNLRHIRESMVIQPSSLVSDSMAARIIGRYEEALEAVHGTDDVKIMHVYISDVALTKINPE